MAAAPGPGPRQAAFRPARLPSRARRHPRCRQRLDQRLRRRGHRSGAQVTVVSERLADLRRLEDRWPHRLVTLPSTAGNIERAITGADLVVSGVLVPGGAAAPKLVSREALRLLGDGAVVVDVSIDQGGSFETSRPTSHTDPVFVDEGVVHYCVPNMPGAVPHTSTLALTAATISYVIEIARLGVDEAMAADASLAKGLMTRDGVLENAAVRQALRL